MGPLHLIAEELDELVESCLDDVLAGLEKRLWFEVWADAREAE